ncbi:sigma factor-like helix-turn-helix DNA-binding protein [Knoellia sp. 3-2P3]|uniref:sigma factor-like helix-turn-helix DNA-binding protein n=1 Tax=unclassified Knoellia TaxID=2618719 RepID=UPI0023DB9126|nr:sigma factor-like helix-turn-helix DNA-binding protein [Knoellia sp. 3-2P3]MDF2092584.1 sigma factor-like helix-turn-helix DNA-binding protein [Knoellia sp. 3-2P3]
MTAEVDEVETWEDESPTPPFGERFPNLRWIGDLELGGSELAPRFAAHERQLVLSWLSREGVRKVRDLLELSFADLLSWRGIGVGKAARIFDAVRDVDDAALPILSSLAFPAGAREADPSVVDTSHVTADLELLVEWGFFAQSATTAGGVIEALRGDKLPADVAASVEALRALPVNAAAQSSPVEILAQWIAALEPRDAAILRHRLVKFEPLTLDEIGSQFRITRERVRQLEGKLITRINQQLVTADWTPVRWAVHQLRVGLGAFAPEEEVPLVDEQGLASYEFGILLWLAEVGRDHNAKVLTRRGFQLPKAADLPLQHGPVIDEGALRDQLVDAGVVPPHLDFAVASIKGVRRLADTLVLWPGNLVDKAHAVLAVRGTPMTPEELAETIGGDFSRAGFRDRLFNAEHIGRVTKTTVGLREWGNAEYTRVADLMVRRLEERGPTPIAQLAAELAAEYDVSTASVHLYAPAPIFVLEAGVLRLRGDEELFTPRNDPASVRGLYLVGEDVAIWHLPADSDILRGSGRALPSEIAIRLGVVPGTRVVLENPLRPIPVSWLETSNTGPALGSIKALADAVAAERGDLLRLRFDRRKRSISCERVLPLGQGLQPPEAIAALTGLPNELCCSRSEIAHAIHASESRTLKALGDRGDSDVAQLVESLGYS